MHISVSTIKPVMHWQVHYQGKPVTVFRSSSGLHYVVEGFYNLLSRVTICYYNTSRIFNPREFYFLPNYFHVLDLPFNPYRIGVISNYED